MKLMYAYMTVGGRGDKVEQNCEYLLLFFQPKVFRFQMLRHLFCPSCQYYGSYFHIVDLHPNRVEFVPCSWAHTVLTKKCSIFAKDKEEMFYARFFLQQFDLRLNVWNLNKSVSSLRVILSIKVSLQVIV